MFEIVIFLVLAPASPKPFWQVTCEAAVGIGIPVRTHASTCLTQCFSRWFLPQNVVQHVDIEALDTTEAFGDHYFKKGPASFTWKQRWHQVSQQNRAHGLIMTKDPDGLFNGPQGPNLWNQAHQDFLEETQLPFIQILLKVTQLKEKVTVRVRSHFGQDVHLDFFQFSIVVRFNLVFHHFHQVGQVTHIIHPIPDPTCCFHQPLELRDIIAIKLPTIRCKEVRTNCHGDIGILIKAMEAKQCPWCERWALKDKSCNYIFACGLDESGNFKVQHGCGRSWCWFCGKKFCGTYIHPQTGRKTPNAREFHDATCCTLEPNFIKEDFCQGGHNSHCETRWEWMFLQKK